MRAERDTVRGSTRRVHALGIAFLNPRTAFVLDPQTFADVCSMTDLLFPNVRKLHFHITDGTLSLIHHIAAPKLRRFRLFFPWQIFHFCRFAWITVSSPNVVNYRNLFLGISRWN